MNQIAVVAGQYQCYRTTDGIHRQPVGAPHAALHDAIAYVDLLDAIPNVSPLRSPTSGSQGTEASPDASSLLPVTRLPRLRASARSGSRSVVAGTE